MDPADCSENCQDPRRETADVGIAPDEAALETPPREDEGKRRRLSSDAAACEEEEDVADAGVCVLASSGRADSVASDDTIITEQDEQDSKLEAMLRNQLTTWGQKLVALQPKVYMTEHLIECGLHLFKYLRQLQLEAAYDGKFPMQYLSNEQLLIHDLVSCWWIALKHASVRTAVPNRTLMCRATNASAELLSDRELAALIAIDWEVQAVLKRGGLVI